MNSASSYNIIQGKATLVAETCTDVKGIYSGKDACQRWSRSALATTAEMVDAASTPDDDDDVVRCFIEATFKHS